MHSKVARLVMPGWEGPRPPACRCFGGLSPSGRGWAVCDKPSPSGQLAGAFVRCWSPGLPDEES